MQKENSEGVGALCFSLFLALSLMSLAHGAQIQASPAMAMEIAKRSNNLGIQLYLILSSAESNNVVFSPLGFTLALGMAQLGARGNTLEEINKVLQLNSSAIHNELKMLRNEITEGRADGVYMEMANILLVKDDVKIRAEYKNKLRLYYRGEVQQVKSLGKHGYKSKADRIVLKEFVAQSATMALVNKVVFKAHWEIPFSVFKRSSFFIPAGRKDIPDKNVQAVFMGLMSDENKLKYFDDEKCRCQVIEMNYGKDLIGDPWDPRYNPADVSMVIALPYADQVLRSLEEELSLATIDRWISKLKLTNIDVSIPKFNIYSLLDAAMSLQELGSRGLFSQSNSGLSDIAEGGVGRLRSVWQEASATVSETGTEPAREPSEDVSIVLISNPKKTFHAVRPFLFFIRDKPTNTILYMGRVANPNEH
jgi:serine protease inhibitor